MTKQSEIARCNLQSYTDEHVVRRYYRLDQLWEAERVILDQLRSELRGKKLLDVGVGGGRTTGHLLQISRDYTGIDYSPQLVAVVRKKFGLDTVYHCDARDMSRFPAATFDFVLFSANGIDSVEHADRLRVLGEIHRVLKAGGIFVFSSHNRSWKDVGKLPWQLPWRWTRDFFRECVKALRLTRRRQRMKRLEVHEAEYAILNDDGHDYSLLMYYITVPTQIRQLQQLGFVAVEAYDIQGRRVDDDDQSPWIYYLARKV